MSEPKSFPGFNTARTLYKTVGDAIAAAINDIATSPDILEKYPEGMAVFSVSRARKPTYPSKPIYDEGVLYVGWEGTPDVYSISYTEVNGEFGWVYDAIP